jgi:hypothetical protein
MGRTVLFCQVGIAFLNIVAHLIKVRTVEPEKQPLLKNVSETTFVSRQLLGKHVPAANNRGTVGNGVFYSVRAMRL